jgi:hypothetical protein
MEAARAFLIKLERFEQEAWGRKRV